MELGSLVSKTFLTCAEGSEIFSGFGHNISKDLKSDSTGWLLIDLYIEETSWVRHVELII
jgi:hypothetical protein